ncbi:MAG TPA: CGNR zinc finger domain-containing protein [Actinomycetota bacterium]|nr:CGNR zinc finger domain-containing protein [Actinomycetota bacterium]
MAEKAAPAPLGLVQDFVNTADLEGGVEELTDPVTLKGWLAERELLDPSDPVTDADVLKAKELREGFRDALVANHEGQPDPGAIDAINHIARNARLYVRLHPDGTSSLESDALGVDRALGRLLAISYTAMADGTWTRLKICRRDSCRWAFYDHSKNRSGNWCSMAVCGNKEKAAAYRARHAERAS